jgi:hypothetical protein
LVHIGSAAEYGGAPHGSSQDETAELRPGAAYGYTKLAGSELGPQLPPHQADTALIAKHLGWVATIGLDQSLADTWAARGSASH